MWARLVAYARANPVDAAIWAAGAALALVAVGLFLARAIPQNFSGEAFYDFQYPYRYSFLESSRVFFMERIRSRLVHGIFVSALYHTFGFNPPAIYLSAFLTIIATAVVITFTIKRFIRSPWMAALLVVTFTWLPLNITDLMALKKIHHVLGWFLFWLAVLLFQSWVSNKRVAWLLGATLAFLASVLSYEAALALLPVAVILSAHHIRGLKDWANKLGVAIWITLLSGLVILNLETLKPFSGIGQVYSADLFAPGHIFQSAAAQIPQIPAAIWRGVLFGDGGFTSGALLFAQALLVLLLIGIIFVLWRAFSVAKTKKRHVNDALVLCVAGAFLAAANYAPFLLAGQPPDGDSLRGAAFGLILVALGSALLFSSQWRQRAWMGRLALVAVCGFWIYAGGSAYAQLLDTARHVEDVIRNFAVTLKVQIPEVPAGTEFIFVNAGLGRTGCIGALNMLYDQGDLHCIHLLAGDTQETYVRVADGLQETGRRLFPDRFIILTFDAEGRVTIIDELGAEAYADIPVTWQSSEPLHTDRSLILPLSPGENLDFYNYVLGLEP